MSTSKDGLVQIKVLLANDQQRKKYRLARWEILCQPKDQGAGNKCLLRKWLIKLCNEDGVWQQLIRNKYLNNKTLSQVEKMPGDSHFWSGLMEIKCQFLNLGSFILKNGIQIRVWEDTWLGIQTLKHQYHSLFNIVRNKHTTIAEVLSSSPLNIPFRRALLGDKLIDWHSLVLRVSNIMLQEENDIFIWDLPRNGSFTIRSMYKYLVNSNIPVPQDIWHTKLPLKIKIFIWYLKKGVLLTKYNLSRRNWHGDKSCAFCGRTETIQNLSFECQYAKFLWRCGQKHSTLLLLGATGLCWALWLSRNDIVFAKTPPKSFLQVLFRGTHWLRVWAKLQQNEDKTQVVIQCCQRLETVALQVFASFGWPYVARLSFPGCQRSETVALQ
ncbi:hypothetical protein U9M48_024997, partial [Paspalum notatum var. saurae]